MLKGMVGTKELQAGVEDIRQELPSMRAEIIEQIQADIRTEFSNALQAYEVRMEAKAGRFLDNLSKTIEDIVRPDNVVNAIEQREEDLKRQEKIKQISDRLSVIYTIEKEGSLLEKTARGGNKLTKEGTKLYRLLSETVVMIAKLYGSKSHTKVANPQSYGKFEEREGIDEPLIKKRVTVSDGTGRESVYVDLIYRGIVGEFTRFLEQEYLNEKEDEHYA